MRAEGPWGHVTLVQTTTGTAPCLLHRVRKRSAVQEGHIAFSPHMRLRNLTPSGGFPHPHPPTPRQVKCQANISYLAQDRVPCGRRWRRQVCPRLYTKLEVYWPPEGLRISPNHVAFPLMPIILLSKFR